MKENEPTILGYLGNILQKYELLWDDMTISVKEVRGRARATITGKKDGYRLSLIICESDLGDDLPKESDYKNEVISLRKEKLTQQEIANRLGISQSYVSMLLKDAKKKEIGE